MFDHLIESKRTKNRKRTFGLNAVSLIVIWQSAPAGASPGLLALDLAGVVPQHTLPTALNA